MQDDLKNKIASELERLHSQGTLNADEYGRLKRLYGLDAQVKVPDFSVAVKENCHCGEKLTWTPEYNRYFCHKCRQYPPTCPHCQHDMFWVREHNRYYCNTCGKYK